MPTSTGKPKVGERIRVNRNISNNPDLPNPDWVYGVVTRREDGLTWSLHWKPEDEHLGGRSEAILNEAGWLMEKGFLEVVGN